MQENGMAGPVEGNVLKTHTVKILPLQPNLGVGGRDEVKEELADPKYQLKGWEIQDSEMNQQEVDAIHDLERARNVYEYILSFGVGAQSSSDRRLLDWEYRIILPGALDLKNRRRCFDILTGTLDKVPEIKEKIQATGFVQSEHDYKDKALSQLGSIEHAIREFVTTYSAETSLQRDLAT